ncbi:MAG: TniB family NTP-binding protein [Moraxellaceae bacterium]
MTLDSREVELVKTMGDLVIHYPMFKTALERLVEVFDLSQVSNQSAAMMVLGESGTGKSTLLKAFMERYPRQITEEKTSIPVLSVEIPSRPTIKSTADAILTQFDRLYVGGSAGEKTKRIKLLIKQCEVRVIVFDEFQHFIDRGTTTANTAVADWIKGLMNETKVSVVIFGLPRAARILRYNDQLRRRFSAAIKMRPWVFESSEDIREFKGIIKALERATNLPAPGELHTEDMMRRLFFASGGLIGYLAKLVTMSACTAMKNGDGRITIAHLHSTFIKHIWAEATSNRNPFNESFEWRPLNRANEPFEPVLI